MAGPEANMRRFLRQFHRWIGLPVSILFLITLTSGLIVGGEELVSAYNKMEQAYGPTTVAENALAIEKITAEVRGLRSIVMPTPDTPFYQARAQGVIRTYRIGDHKLIHEQISSRSGFFQTVLRLHRNFLIGRDGAFGLSGAELSAWVSLTAITLSLMGLYLWWRMRRSFRLRKLLPSGSRRGDFFQSHIHGGILVMIPILILGITGASITYRPIARSVLEAEQVSASGLKDHPFYIVDNWANWLSKANAAMPEGELRSIHFPRGRSNGSMPVFGTVEPRRAIQFRYVTSRDWLGVAGSRVYIDPGQSGFLGAAPFDSLPLGQQLYMMIVPVHTGRNVSSGYLAIMLLFAALATVVTVSGIVSMTKHLRQQSQAKR